MTRHDGRRTDELRAIEVTRGFTGAAPGSVLLRAGRTTVLCTASIDESVPPWKMRGLAEGAVPTGWVTAEYNMLPGSTSPRKARRPDGRGTEIQRLIGRSLRAIVDFEALGPRTIAIDCDVLEADGGTRTLSITGGFLALAEAVAKITAPDFAGPSKVFRSSVAAVSVGVFEGVPLLDLDYHEDSRADVDMNVVMTGSGEFIEVQGTAEGRTFSRESLDQQLALAEKGIADLTAIQREALGPEWPLDSNSISC